MKIVYKIFMFAWVRIVFSHRACYGNTINKCVHGNFTLVSLRNILNFCVYFKYQIIHQWKYLSVTFRNKIRRDLIIKIKINYLKSYK